MVISTVIPERIHLRGTLKITPALTVTFFMTMAGIMLPLFSFERTGDGDKKYVNSKVCLLSLIKGNLSATHKQSVVYNLMSLIGHNPCLV